LFLGGMSLEKADTSCKLNRVWRNQMCIFTWTIF
jgi:hypothetical protein